MPTDETHDNKIGAYREYAKQAILAASAINSGALIAALVSIETLSQYENTGAAFLCWTAGLGVATFCWLAAYLANDGYAKDKDWQNSAFTAIGVFAIFASICLFCAGGWFVSQAFSGGARP